MHGFVTGCIIHLQAIASGITQIKISVHCSTRPLKMSLVKITPGLLVSKDGEAVEHHHWDNYSHLLFLGWPVHFGRFKKTSFKSASQTFAPQSLIPVGEVFSLGCNSNNGTGAPPHENRTFSSQENPWVPLSPQIQRRQPWGLIKVRSFPASSGTFVNETGLLMAVWGRRDKMTVSMNRMSALSCAWGLAAFSCAVLALSVQSQPSTLWLVVLITLQRVWSPPGRCEPHREPLMS